jgi:hypothetical protein
VAHGALPVDPAVIRAVARLNTIEIPTLGKRGCAGVYATVTVPGMVRVGDRVQQPDP